MLAVERETTIAYSDADEEVLIYTCIKRDLTVLRKNPAFKQVRSGTYKDGTEWGDFRLPVDQFGSVSSLVKRKRNLTDEQRQAVADRLANSRKPKA
jgi:hypothetical protein